jgi:PAS domain S-box-containing protein
MSFYLLKNNNKKPDGYAEKKRVFFLVLVMLAVALTIGGSAITILYRAALKEEHSRLTETVQSQARLLEAVARFDQKYSHDFPQGAEAATMSQVHDAHDNYQGFGETGEFVIAKKKDDQIIFLLRHHHDQMEIPKPIAFSSNWAEPMRRALSNRSGTIIGLDYDGVEVLAAYEPVATLNLGIVAKIDLEEIRSPFVTAAGWVGVVAFIVITIGSFIFLYVSEPLIRRILEQSKIVKEERELLRVLIDTIPDLIFFKNRAGVFLGCNKAFEKRVGQPREKIIGHTVEDLFPPKESDDYKSSDSFIIANDKQIKLEEVVKLSDGTTLVYDTVKTPFTSPDGKSLGLISIARDITDRKETEKP